MENMEQTVTNEQVFAKLCEVEALLKGQQLRLGVDSLDIWDCKQVAEYFKVTTEHARRWIVVDPRFPKPVDLYSRTGKGKGNAKNRYVSGEVIQYALKFRKK